MIKDIESGTIYSNIQLNILPPTGFDLPPNCHWDSHFDNGVKNGIVQVLTDDGILFARLSYKENKLEGECLFYDGGSLCEKAYYQNDRKHGWSTSYENGKESISLFEKGVQKRRLLKCDGEDMWKEVDMNNEWNYSLCKLDKQFRHQGICKKFVQGILTEESMYKDDKVVRKCREIRGREMTEYDENGVKIYQGEYKQDLKKGYIRDGKGKEFVDGVVSYVGGWRKGCKEGEGKSMKDNIVYYSGRWKDDLPNGEGKIMNEDGSVMIEGKWNDGELVVLQQLYLIFYFYTFDYQTGKTRYHFPGMKHLYLKGIMVIYHLILMPFILDWDHKDHETVFNYNQRICVLCIGSSLLQLVNCSIVINFLLLLLNVGINVRYMT